MTEVAAAVRVLPGRFLPAFSAVALLVSGGCSRPAAERICWDAMGTVAAVQTKGSLDETKESVAVVKDVFARVAKLLNAHDPSSEINALAKLSDSRAVASCDRFVRGCYEAAFSLRDRSKGAFDPRWRGEGTLDFGAIAKGFAVDCAAEALSGRPPSAACLVDLGGNLKSVCGEWKVGVRNPEGTGFAATVVLGRGESLATSATYFRGRHIRDGRTRSVVSNGVASVTVLCRSAATADGLSTALFVLGPEEGRRLLEETRSASAGGVAVFWIMDDGRTFGDARFDK